MSAGLCSTFQELGALTWQRMTDAQRAGLKWSEETNTETLLLELGRRHPAQIVIQAFNRSEEASNGADWEWHIGSPGCWAGLRVQAKRLEPGSSDFKRLQTQKAKKQKLPQIDNLLAHAKKDRLNPAYCFYLNRSPAVGFGPVTGVRPQTIFTPSGCFMADGVAVKATRSNNFSKLSSLMFPWHWMVCDCLAASHSLPSGSAVQALLGQSRMSALDARGDLDVEPLFPPAERLPTYLAQYELDLDRLPPPELDSNLRRVAAERSLAGFVIIRTESE
ncbi:DUF6615 family protein [Devosia sp. Root105]|uniref:DUF6615 family protein n=1 Tax=Devosia sp. Root105 TaxID=1736423 RepID=UPI0006F292B4|nr:DUF6615 family protein [Devosia sp. Root105]